MRSKLLIIALASVAIISLSVNIVLFVRLSRTRAEGEKWRAAHQRLADRVLQVERERENSALSPLGHSEFLLDPSLATQSASEGSPAPKNDGETDEICWEEVQEILASVIDEKFPELVLSDRDLMELTGSVRIIRECMQAMRDMERTSANAEAMRGLHVQLNSGLQVFEEITGMAAGGFMGRARTRSGIDNEEPDDGQVVTEYLRDFRP